MGLRVVREVGWQKESAKAKGYSRKRVWVLLAQCPALSGFASFQCSVKETVMRRERGMKRKR